MLVSLRLYSVCDGRQCSYYVGISDVCSTNWNQEASDRIRKNGFSQIVVTKKNRPEVSFNTVFVLSVNFVFCLGTLLFWTSLLTF